MARKKIRFGIIGLGLMGREFGSAVARWCNLLSDGPVPVITGICNRNPNAYPWFVDNFPDIKIITDDYRQLLISDEIDAVYCAVPHNFHEEIYINSIYEKKHLLGEKPFGIDLKANINILNAIRANPDVIVRCSSEFPYFPACQKLIRWIEGKRYGRLIEVRTGFHHSSDLDLNKPINWKRREEINGAYGCMGDLGLHVLHIPYHFNWKILNVFADLQKIAEFRPDANGKMVPCTTWDNAVLICKASDPVTNKEFSLVAETKRMAPGATNNWFIEVYGTDGSAKFSTHNPKAFTYLENSGREQGWTTIDVGSQSAFPTITGGIFEFGFADAFQQMLGAFMNEFSESASEHPFRNLMPEDTLLSHLLFTSALESNKRALRIDIPADISY